MKRIVFVIHTEYHLLFALRVISAFHDRTNDSITIYRLSPLNSKRLNRPLNFSETGIEYKEIRYQNQNFKDKNLRQEIDEIAESYPDILYISNEHQKVYPYLFSKLKDINTQIVLCPDGANVYVNYTTLKERVVQYIFGNIYLWSNRFPSYISMPKSHYAYRKEIDTVIVEDQVAYRNYTHKKVIELGHNRYNKEDVKDLSNHIFQFNPASLQIAEGSVLWIDQPLDGMDDERYNLLFELKQKYPNKHFYFKPHPHSLNRVVEMYENLSWISVVRQDLPIELIMENMVDCSFMSAYSTAMYYYNSSCKYYWVSALFPRLPEYYHQNLPFKHINIVTDFNQIQL